MTWLSPAFPVGGFSYSHGLEWVVEAGKVKHAASLGDWIEDILVHGAGRTDAIFLAEAWRAVAASDEPLLAEAAELAAAFAPSAERRLETLAQGAAFLVPCRRCGRIPRSSGLPGHTPKSPIRSPSARAPLPTRSRLPPQRRRSCRPSPPISSRPACA